MNMDSKAAFPMPNTSSSRWRKDHATQNKFGDSNNNQANFALISGPKDQEAAEDEEGLPECFPYGATMPKCKKSHRNASRMYGATMPKCKMRNVGIESSVTILAMSSKRLISEDIIKSNILAGWGSLGSIVLLMPSLIAIIAFTAELILLLVPH